MQQYAYVILVETDTHLLELSLVTYVLKGAQVREG